MNTRNDTDKTRPTPRPRAFAGLTVLLLLAGSVGALPQAILDDAPAEPDVETKLAEVCQADIQFDDEFDRMWDYGDAPDSRLGTVDSYPTGYVGGGNPLGVFPTRATTTNSVYGNQPGARHHVVDVGWLGDINPAPGNLTLLDVPTREWDADQFPDEDVTVTNLDPTTRTPDHDGRDNGLYPDTVFAHTVDDVRFRISTVPGIQEWYINMLVDWDFDGEWRGFDANGAPEWAVQNKVVSAAPMTSKVVSHNIAVGSTPGEPWVRVTLTPRPIPPSPTGAGWDGSVPPGFTDVLGRQAFSCGETEDHCGRLTVSSERHGDDLTDERIECRKTEEPHDDDCSNPHVISYPIDISTGYDNGQVPWYTQDDDWYAESTPNTNVDQPVYAIKAHPWGVWHSPTHGRWVNPYGDTQANWEPHNYENNHADAALGHYVYAADFAVNDPLADAVKMDFTWWRDDRSQPPNGFTYHESTTATWTSISTGTGFGTSAGTPASYVDATPESTYRFRVHVDNLMTFTGLLVEGEMQVYCVPVVGGI